MKLAKYLYLIAGALLIGLIGYADGDNFLGILMGVAIAYGLFSLLAHWERRRYHMQQISDENTGQ